MVNLAKKNTYFTQLHKRKKSRGIGKKQLHKFINFNVFKPLFYYFSNLYW